MPDSKPHSERLAQQFHEVYERLAPDFAYETREESAVAWIDVPPKNRDLMIATVEEVMGGFFEQLEASRIRGEALTNAVELIQEERDALRRERDRLRTALGRLAGGISEPWASQLQEALDESDRASASYSGTSSEGDRDSASPGETLNREQAHPDADHGVAPSRSFELAPSDVSFPASEPEAVA